jgi:hypothetical protein
MKVCKGLIMAIAPIVGVISSLVLGTRVSWSSVQYPIIPGLGLLVVGTAIASAVSFIVSRITRDDDHLELSCMYGMVSVCSFCAAILLVASL